MDPNEDSPSNASFSPEAIKWATSILACAEQCHDNYKAQKLMLPYEWQALLSKCKKPAIESAYEVFNTSFQEPFLHFLWEKDGSFISPENLKNEQEGDRHAEYFVLDSICHQYIYCSTMCALSRPYQLFIDMEDSKAAPQYDALAEKINANPVEETLAHLLQS